MNDEQNVVGKHHRMVLVGVLMYRRRLRGTDAVFPWPECAGRPTCSRSIR